MKFILLILFLFFSIVSYSQVGKRLKEHKNQKKLVRHISMSGWKYKKTSPGLMQSNKREGAKLFKRVVQPNKKMIRREQSKINAKRVRSRVRGNNVFHKKKYRFS